jgi:hypothetical protein
MKVVTPGTIQQWIEDFVDDTSLFSNLPRDSNNPNDVKLLHKKLRRDMILWSMERTIGSIGWKIST